jgi:hypothetical protein
MTDYVPQNPTEQHYFENLFRIANVDGTEELGGRAAVQFFNQSGVDTGFLKQIWALSTPAATMNRQQFFTALRFITMIQNGEFPISKGTISSEFNFQADNTIINVFSCCVYCKLLLWFHVIAPCCYLVPND